ncbi:MAG: hypothetical protein ABEH43_02960, partial [Flavobacteriales bacterium]
RDYFFSAVSDLLSAFKPFKGKSQILRDWLSSLKAEEKRRENAEQEIGNDDLPQGYRDHRVLYFYYYDKLRQELEGGEGEWRIYSGGNNPVMNWHSEWVPLSEEDPEIKVFLELNWDELKVKARVRNKDNEQHWDKWQKLREKRVLPFKEMIGTDEKSQNRRGEHVTAIKKSLNLEEKPIQEVAKKE